MLLAFSSSGSKRSSSRSFFFLLFFFVPPSSGYQNTLRYSLLFLKVTSEVLAQLIIVAVDNYALNFFPSDFSLFLSRWTRSENYASNDSLSKLPVLLQKNNLWNTLPTGFSSPLQSWWFFLVLCPLGERYLFTLAMSSMGLLLLFVFHLLLDRSVIINLFIPDASRLSWTIPLEFWCGTSFARGNVF